MIWITNEWQENRHPVHVDFLHLLHRLWPPVPRDKTIAASQVPLGLQMFKKSAYRTGWRFSCHSVPSIIHHFSKTHRIVDPRAPTRRPAAQTMLRRNADALHHNENIATITLGNSSVCTALYEIGTACINISQKYSLYNQTSFSAFFCLFKNNYFHIVKNENICFYIPTSHNTGFTDLSSNSDGRRIWTASASIATPATL